MTNLDSMLKSRDIILLTKEHIVKVMVFPVVLYRCEKVKKVVSLGCGFTCSHRCETIKKVECRRIDAFKLRSWRRLLRVPWTSRRSNRSILKEINPKYSLEGLMLNLKLQYLAT